MKKLLCSLSVFVLLLLLTSVILVSALPEEHNIMLISKESSEASVETSEEEGPLAVWNDKGGIPYTYYYGGKAFAIVYNHTAGDQGTWAQFTKQISTVDEGYCMKFILTGSFPGAKMTTVELRNTGYKLGTKPATLKPASVSENEIIFYMEGPATLDQAKADPCIEIQINSATGISDKTDTHLVVTLEKIPAVTTTTSVATTTANATTSANQPTSATSATSEDTSSDVFLGDAVADGVLDMKDVLAMRKYIAKLDVEINLTNADYNVDSAIDMKDVLALRKALAHIE